MLCYKIEYHTLVRLRINVGRYLTLAGVKGLEELRLFDATAERGIFHVIEGQIGDAEPHQVVACNGLVFKWRHARRGYQRYFNQNANSITTEDEDDRQSPDTVADATLAMIDVVKKQRLPTCWH